MRSILQRSFAKAIASTTAPPNFTHCSRTRQAVLLVAGARTLAGEFHRFASLRHPIFPACKLRYPKSRDIDTPNARFPGVVCSVRAIHREFMVIVRSSQLLVRAKRQMVGVRSRRRHSDTRTSAGRPFDLADRLRALDQTRHRRELAKLDRAHVDPSGAAGWIAYRAAVFSDVHPDFTSFNSLLYTTVLAPSATKVVQHQAMLPPWQVLWKAIRITEQFPTRGNIMNLLLGSVMIILAALAWKRMRVSYRLLTIGIFAIAFAYYTGPETPYMGLSRHLLLAFPVFICSAPALERWKGPVAAIFMMGMLFATASYVVESWVP